ncbi:hypothetical protein BDZ94DRAFT_1264170 [Collybia nuda]|uniref:Uncharacterized protein n=1 Tax=Collybia nuda TaxID=64659 RepID=A0A9P5Y2Z4_9AGAR|nr:hypothetical protein BDZ94DRAFT_1264170 [Collybia nuda]
MPVRPNARPGLSFFGTIGLVMAALKLKQNWDDQYGPVASEDEDRVALASHSPYRDVGADDEARIGLLDTEIPTTRRKSKRSGCCVCCGINCSLFWKAFGIVLAGFALWYSFKFVRWAVTPAPTGLESMPLYNISFGCLSAPYIYNSSKTTFNAPIGWKKFDHAFDIRGSAAGTFVIAEGAVGSQEIEYEMTIRTDDSSLLQDISVHFPDMTDDGVVSNSRVVITTPRIDPSSSSCMRYDITMYVPRNLKKLHVASHSPMHVQFDSVANVELDDLYVTMFAMDRNNMILPRETIRANRMALEVYRGWIVGDVSIVNSTSITTQRGDGVANVRVHPTAPGNLALPDPAYLRTTTGAGRTDIFYIASKAFRRPIHNVHMSSRNADMHLTYREAEYSGRIELESRSYTATGLHSFPRTLPSKDDEGGADRSPRWTHWVGNQGGDDTVYVKSRGWTGLYF